MLESLRVQKRGKEEKEERELNSFTGDFQVSKTPSKFLLFLLFPTYPLGNTVLLTLPSLSLWDSCPPNAWPPPGAPTPPFTSLFHLPLRFLLPQAAAPGGRPRHRACAHRWLRQGGPGAGSQSARREKGRGSCGRALVGSEPEAQTLRLLLGQAEPALLGPVAAKELSPAPTAAWANCLARLAASPARSSLRSARPVSLSPSSARPLLPPPPRLRPGPAARPAAVMCDKEFMWALKNGDLDEVKDYVAKVSGRRVEEAGWSGGWGSPPAAGPAGRGAGERRPAWRWRRGEAVGEPRWLKEGSGEQARVPSPVAAVAAPGAASFPSWPLGEGRRGGRRSASLLSAGAVSWALFAAGVTSSFE